MISRAKRTSWNLGDGWILVQGPLPYPKIKKDEFVLVGGLGQHWILKGFTQRAAMKESRLRMDKEARWCEDLPAQLDNWKEHDTAV